MGSALKADAGVHRLTDMVVEEVSAVDRAANKRKFIVVKSDQGEAPMKPKIVVPDGKGGFVEKADTAETTETEGTETDATKDAGAETETETEKDSGDKTTDDLVLSKAAKDTLEKAVSLALEDLTKAAESIKGSTVKADATDAVPEELAKTISGVGEKLFEAFKGMHGKPKDHKAAPDKKDDKADDKAAKPQQHKCTSCKGDMTVGSKFCSACGTKAAKTDTSKASAKSKADTALKTLDALVQILASISGGTTEGASSVTKADLPVEAQAIIKVVEGLRSDVTVEKKRSDTLATELLELKKARGDSNANIVEGREGVAKEDEPFVWARDLNDPVRADNTPKDTSFFDES